MKQAIAEETTRQQEKDLCARCHNGSSHPQSTLTKTRLIYTSKIPKATTHKKTQGNLTWEEPRVTWQERTHRAEKYKEAATVKISTSE